MKKKSLWICLAFIFVVISVLIILNPIKVFEYDKDTNKVTIDGVTYEEFLNTNGLLNFSYDDLSFYAWSWKNPFGAFFSQSSDSPTFVVPSRAASIWFKEGFSYQEQIFEIENTNITITFSDSYIEGTETDLDEDTKFVSFKWYMKDTVISNFPSLYSSDDGIYIRFVWDEPCYKISDEFLRLLIENDVI